MLKKCCCKFAVVIFMVPLQRQDTHQGDLKSSRPNPPKKTLDVTRNGGKGGETGFKDEAFFGSCVGVSKNRGTPKWMVKTMENPIKMDDLGVPLFSETSM